MSQVLHIENKLLAYRFVQIKSLLQCFFYFRRKCFFTVKRSARNGVHGKECDTTDNKNGDNSEKNSLCNVFSHVNTLLFVFSDNIEGMRFHLYNSGFPYKKVPLFSFFITLV